ncbi:MAG: hypothetical protein LBH43_04620 [Treponema sp.]|jgi:hypothetical protein|nr:hypothetical protein [Treponema sp.]
MESKYDPNLPIYNGKYSINQPYMLYSIGFIIEAVATVIKKPVKINSLYYVINSLDVFMGPDVPVNVDKLDKQYIINILKTLFIEELKMPWNSGIDKCFIASFVDSLPDNVVQKDKTKVNKK